MKVTQDFCFSCEKVSLSSSFPHQSQHRLDIFNSVVLHHLSENPNLTYGILSTHKTFEDLGTFTLSRGLREIKRVQSAKEEQTRKLDSKGKGSADYSESSDPGAEKTRLLESESGAGDMQIDSVENMHDIPRYPERQEDRRDGELEVVTQSFMSPNLEAPLSGGVPVATSEKARGKMKERRSLSLETNSSLDRVAASGVGRNGFVPTQEWVGLTPLFRTVGIAYYIPGHFLAPRVGPCYKPELNLITDRGVGSPLILLCF